MAANDRPLANYPPSVWHSIPELSSLTPNVTMFESYTKQVNELLEKVKNMMVDKFIDPVEKVRLIDLLCRLGVSYHFESEIDEELARIFFTENLIDYTKHDLLTVALVFGVFRQHGYKVSCDVFDRFKASDGEFNKYMETDVNGLLKLYEASHLSMHGEDILDEALVYTRLHLTNLRSLCTNTRVAAQIGYALQQPYHRGIPRLETRRFISFYEDDPLCNKILLELAKVDFNRLQILYQQEFNELSRWRQDLNFEKHFFYGRDRLVETYLWSVGIYFEPQYQRARLFATKFLQMLAFTDDTYDSYGKPEELRLLTKAIQRWDIEAVEQVPENMRYLYTIYMDLYRGMKCDLEEEGRSHCVSYFKDAVIQASEVFQVEVEWLNSNYEPSFDEYIENALYSTCYHAAAVLSLVGMGETVGVNEFEWLKRTPKIDRASMMICRIMDELVTRQNEPTTGIDCYMKQYNMIREDVIKAFWVKISDAWKDINEECTKPTSTSMEVLSRIRNLARVMDVLYKYKDTYTDPSLLKNSVKAILVDTIPTLV